MSLVQHISMRVPRRHRPWDDRICNRPLDNSSCLLLKNIGDRREDAWEETHAGTSIAELANASRLARLTESRDTVLPM